MCVLWQCVVLQSGQTSSKHGRGSHRPDAVRRLGATIIRSSRCLTSLLCLFRVIRKCCLNSINTNTHTHSFGKCNKIYCMTKLVHCNGQTVIERLAYASIYINQMFYQRAVRLHDKYCAGSVKDARIRISVNSFCRQARPHMEKCDSHYLSDSSEAVALGYCSPLQTRKRRVVLGTGRLRFPPSH